MNYFRRLQLRFKYRKEISTLINTYLQSTGEAIGRREMKLMRQDFSKILNHKPVFAPTEKNFRDFIESEELTIDIGEMIKKAMLDAKNNTTTQPY